MEEVFEGELEGEARVLLFVEAERWVVWVLLWVPDQP